MPRLAPVIKISLLAIFMALPPLNRDGAVLNLISLQFQNATEAGVQRSLILAGTFPESALHRGERASAGQYGMEYLRQPGGRCRSDHDDGARTS
jgi:hypothetical protein